MSYFKAVPLSAEDAARFDADAFHRDFEQFCRDWPDRVLPTELWGATDYERQALFDYDLQREIAYDALCRRHGYSIERISPDDNIYTGGKLGRFELRDAARDLPEIASKAATLGYRGTEGAAAVAAQAKIIRDTTGTSAEPKTNLSALYSYLASPEFGKNLAKFGIDRDKLYRDAASRGEIPLDRILDAMRAKGLDRDPIKLGQAITSDEARKGALPLLQTDYRGLRDQIMREGPGSIETDFQRTMQTAQASMDKFGAAIDSVTSAAGEAFAPALARAADAMTGLLAWLLDGKDTIKRGLEE